MPPENDDILVPWTRTVGDGVTIADFDGVPGRIVRLFWVRDEPTRAWRLLANAHECAGAPLAQVAIRGVSDVTLLREPATLILEQSIVTRAEVRRLFGWTEPIVASPITGPNVWMALQLAPGEGSRVTRGLTFDGAAVAIHSNHRGHEVVADIEILDRNTHRIFASAVVLNADALIAQSNVLVIDQDLMRGLVEQVRTASFVYQPPPASTVRGRLQAAADRLRRGTAVNPDAEDRAREWQRLWNEDGERLERAARPPRREPARYFAPPGLAYGGGGWPSVGRRRKVAKLKKKKAQPEPVLRHTARKFSLDDE